MHKACSSTKTTILNNADPDMVVTKMFAPVSINSDLYFAPIKESVLKLSNDGLLVNNTLSPILETSYGYHFFQLFDIQIPDSVELLK